MKKGISLILLIIMLLVVIILGYVCILAINNNSSFFNIKEYKNLKANIQLDINDIIYDIEDYMGRGYVIEPGYITDSDFVDNLPKIICEDSVRYLSSDIIPSLYGENIDNIKIYLDENGIVSLKYFIFEL